MAEMFPDNGVLRRGGELLFTNLYGGERSQLKLSPGERLVLYYFGAVLYAPDHAFVAVESPELFCIRRLCVGCGTVWKPCGPTAGLCM